MTVPVRTIARVADAIAAAIESDAPSSEVNRRFEQLQREIGAELGEDDE